MNYLIFNSDILVSDGENVQRISKGTKPDHLFDFVGPVRVAILDVDLLLASAIEFPIEKRDNICVRKIGRASCRERVFRAV